jgi:hypothetical protein
MTGTVVVVLGCALGGCPEKKQGETDTREDIVADVPKEAISGDVKPETTPDGDVAPDQDGVPSELPDGQPDVPCTSSCAEADPAACNAAANGIRTCQKEGACWNWVDKACLTLNHCSKGPEECVLKEETDPQGNVTEKAVCQPLIAIPAEITDPWAKDDYYAKESTKGCLGEAYPGGTKQADKDCWRWNCVDGSKDPPKCEGQAQSSEPDADDCDPGDCCIDKAYCFQGTCSPGPGAAFCPVTECNTGIQDLTCDDQDTAVHVLLNDPTYGFNQMDGYCNVKNPSKCDGFETGYEGHERVFKITPQSWTTKTDFAQVTVFVELSDPATVGQHIDAFWWVPETAQDPCYPNLCMGGAVMSSEGRNVLSIDIPLYNGAPQSDTEAEAVYLLLDGQDGDIAEVRVSIDCGQGMGAEPFCGDEEDTNFDSPDCAGGIDPQDSQCKGSAWCEAGPTPTGKECTPHTKLTCGQTTVAQALGTGTTLVEDPACASSATYGGKKQLAYLADPDCTSGEYSVAVTHKSGKKLVDAWGMSTDCEGAKCLKGAWYDSLLFTNPVTLTFDAGTEPQSWVIVSETFDATAADAIFDISLDCSKCTK